MNWGEKGTGLEILVWGIMISIFLSIMVSPYLLLLGIIVSIILAIKCRLDHESTFSSDHANNLDWIPPYERNRSNNNFDYCAYMNAYGDLPDAVKNIERRKIYDDDIKIMNICNSLSPQERTPDNILYRCHNILNTTIMGVDSNGFYRQIRERELGASTIYGKKYFPSGKRVFASWVKEIYHAIDD